MAVVIPSTILSVIAVRSLSREEAYIEKRMEETLLSEVIHAASLIQSELKDIREELSDSLSSTYYKVNFQESFKQWKKKSSLVKTPFLLAPSGEIIYPVSKEELSRQEELFLDSSWKFFKDQVSIPVYENIAVAYQQEILEETEKLPPKKYSRSLVDQARQVSSEFTSSLGRSSAQRLSSDDQISQVIFEQSEPVRKKVYDQAKESGKQIAFRKVQFAGKSVPKEKDTSRLDKQQSIFISEPQTFSQIISGKHSGVIPRFIEDQLWFLFWSKLADNRIAGCVINQQVLKDRVLGVLPNLYSPARVLTVLDENGKPLIMPVEKSSQEWRLPFVAREISATLPHWEVAAYLSSPDLVSTKAGIVTLIMWVLILILFVSIVSGGTLVLKSLHAEMALARQKTTFVANVSHELKTPLTSIRMFAEMLKERRQPDEEKKKKYLDLMVSETGRLTRIINNVLDFSRMEQGQKQYSFEQINIVALCRELVDNQRLDLENKGFVLNFSSSANQIPVKADSEAIKQALLNLFSNAEKYSVDLKRIDLIIDRNDTDVFVSLKDRGKGISGSESKNIFKEFYRVDDSLTSRAKGTGLGLTIAKRIAKDHGGDIVYEPRQGQGSIFKIKLPLLGA